MTDTSDNTSAPDPEGNSHTVLCGFCKVPITFRVETDPDGKAGCTACDNWANQEEIGHIVQQFVQDATQRSLNSALSDAARNSKSLNFKGQTLNHKSYRFVVEL